MPPTLANGKVCYIEMPALDIHGSAEFYAKVVGWRILAVSSRNVAH